MDPEANWKQLLNVYSEEGIALALGAGVSVKSKLPAWDELLRRIAKKCLKENEHQLVDVLISEGFSLPSIAGILEGQCPDRKFVDLLRDALYDDFKKFYRIPSVEDDPGFVELDQFPHTVTGEVLLARRELDDQVVDGSQLIERSFLGHVSPNQCGGADVEPADDVGPARHAARSGQPITPLMGAPLRG